MNPERMIYSGGDLLGIIRERRDGSFVARLQLCQIFVAHHRPDVD